MSPRKRYVPPEILNPIVDAYIEFKKKNPGKAPDGAAQFEYEGVTYTLKKKGKKGRYSAVPAWMEARDARNRDGRKRNQQIPLGSIEQMMVNNVYQEASKRGLAVDHDIPIAAGGPSNAPWNLKLRTHEVNGAKGDKVGGNYPAEPFLDPQVEAVVDQINRFKSGINAMSAVAGKVVNRAETAHDLFTFGRDGEAVVNKAADVIPGLRANPENDLGKKMSDAYKKASDMNHQVNGLTTM